jgi:hypothetical protein
MTEPSVSANRLTRNDFWYSDARIWSCLTPRWMTVCTVLRRDLPGNIIHQMLASLRKISHEEIYDLYCEALVWIRMENDYSIKRIPPGCGDHHIPHFGWSAEEWIRHDYGFAYYHCTHFNRNYSSLILDLVMGWNKRPFYYHCAIIHEGVNTLSYRLSDVYYKKVPIETPKKSTAEPWPTVGTTKRYIFQDEYVDDPHWEVKCYKYPEICKCIQITHFRRWHRLYRKPIIAPPEVRTKGGQTTK